MSATPRFDALCADLALAAELVEARLAAADRENAELRETLAGKERYEEEAERQFSEAAAEWGRITAENAELRGEVERLREAIRRRDERITDEKLASFIARANGNSWSRPWRIVGYLARCVQDERIDLATIEARLEAVREIRGCLGAGPMDYEQFVDEVDEILAGTSQRLAALSAAPQPEPDVRAAYSESLRRLGRADLVPEPPASDEPARQSPEPDSRRWGGSMRPMPDPYRADHNCVPEGCSECRPECRHCNGSGNAHTFDGDDVGICGTCHGTGSAAGGGL